MGTARYGHTSTLLTDGSVLVVGGYSSGVNGGAELYNPTSGTFASTEGGLITARAYHTATLLANGTVLIAGGQDANGSPTNTAEIYNPSTQLFQTTSASMTTARVGHTATLLANGTVLIAGGYDGANASNTAEIYNPVTDSFTATGNLNAGRYQDSATLLANGKVLVSGGRDNNVSLTSAEIYDPNTQTFTLTGSMNESRYYHTTTLMQNGRVLITGGTDLSTNSTHASAEVYDPVAGTFSATGSMTSPRRDQAAVLLGDGRVLVIGGDLAAVAYATAEAYDPNTGTFTAAGSLNQARYLHTATVLRDGRVLVSGGFSSGSLASAELYTPFTLTSGSLTTGRNEHTSTVLDDGRVLITGGLDNSNLLLNSAELFNPSTGLFTSAGSMTDYRQYHTATLLNDGRVLIAGGYDGSTNVSSAEIFDPSTGNFTATGAMSGARSLAQAVTLSDGRVLMMGGYDGSNFLASAEIYDPATGTFGPTGSMVTGRYAFQATLLSDGRVLVTGGYNPYVQSAAEIYDPTTGTFSYVADMNTGRYSHSATLLNNGMVLIAGGVDGNGITLGTAELFNPATNTFTLTATPMSSARQGHAAVLLEDGHVVLVGGFNGSSNQASADLYDPATNQFAAIGAMSTPRNAHTANLLNNGQVVVIGGDDGATHLTSAELFTAASLVPSNLLSIAISPSPTLSALGFGAPLSAVGTFSDNHTETLQSVIWSSASTATIAVTNDARNHGHAYGVSVGTTTVSACAGSVCGSTGVTVTAGTSDVGVTMSASPLVLSTGVTGNITYTIQVTNNGPNTPGANNVVLTDTLPAGVTLQSINTTVGACSGTTCNFGQMAPAASATVTVVVTATTPAISKLVNTASVSSDDFDPHPANNTASTTTYVSACVNSAPGGYNAVWIGGASSDWGNPANWSMQTRTPQVDELGNGDDVYICASAPNQPVTTNAGNGSVAHNLLVEAGATLNGQSSSVAVHGNVNAIGTIGASVDMFGDGVTLQGTIESLYLGGGAVTLSGDLTSDFFTLAGGSFALNGHTARANLSYYEGPSTTLFMTNPADHLILGDAAFDGSTATQTATLTAGTLEIIGGFQTGCNPYSFYASGNHLTRFIGSGNNRIGESVRSISMCSGGFGQNQFQNLEFATTGTLQANGDEYVAGNLAITGQGVVDDAQSSNFYVLGAFNSAAGSSFSPGDIEVSGPVAIGGYFGPYEVDFFANGAQTLSGNIAANYIYIDSDLSLTSDSILGAVYDSYVDGSFAPNGHTAYIYGETFYTQELAANEVTLQQYPGRLIMNQASDHIILDVDDANFQGLALDANQNSTMTAGTLDVYGDLTAYLSRISSSTTFAPTGTHVTRLIGTGGASSSYQYIDVVSGTNNQFQNLEIGNHSAGAQGDGSNAGIEFGDDTMVAGSLIKRPGPVAYLSSFGYRLTAGNADLNGVIVDETLLTIGGATNFNDVIFQGFFSTDIQLTVNNAGATIPYNFTGVQFLTAADPNNGGSYIQANDTAADANVLQINMIASTPADGSSATSVTGGAVVNWNIPAPLLHWYAFQGDASDLAGGVNGALLGGATAANGSLSLNGSTGYVEFPSQIVPVSGSYTVTFFAQESAPTANNAEIISQGIAGGPGFYIGHDANGVIRAGDGWTNTGVPFPSDGLQHHYALVVDGAIMQAQLYVDGALAATNPNFGPTAAGGTNTRFGMQFGTAGEPFFGSLSDVRIYGAAITPAEVASISAGQSNADLSVRISGQPTDAVNVDFNYIINIANNGPHVASGVTLTTNLPAGSTLSSVNYESPIGITCDGVSGSSAPVHCSIDTLSVGQNVAIFVNAVPANLGVAAYSATVASLNDAIVANNTAAGNVTVYDPNTQTLNDLNILSFTAPATAASGTPVVYDLQLYDNGPVDATGVQARQTLPAGFSFVSATAVTNVLSTADTLQGTFWLNLDTDTQSTSGDIWWEQIDSVTAQMTPAAGAGIVNLGTGVDFDSLTASTLATLNYGSTPIDGNNDSTNQLVTGDVFAVKTVSGHYAKVKVTSYGYNIGLLWFTYGVSNVPCSVSATVTCNVGNGATASSGGTIPVNTTADIQFTLTAGSVPGPAMSTVTASGNEIESSPSNNVASAQVVVSTSAVPVGVIQRVSLDYQNQEAASSDAEEPAVSFNGRLVIFDTSAPMTAEDLNGDYDVYLRDTCYGVASGCTKSTKRVSQAVNGAGDFIDPNNASYSATTDNSGRYVAFFSYATNLLAGLNRESGLGDIFVRDMSCTTPTTCTPTYQVSIGMDGGEPNSYVSDSTPAMSADGRYVAFGSEASNLTPEYNNGYYQIFLRDTCIGAGTSCVPSTRLISANLGGGAPQTDSFYPSMSADSRYVAFMAYSYDNFLVTGDANDDYSHVFLRDTCIGATGPCTPHTIQLDVTPTGDQPQSDSDKPSVSASGRFVAFESSAGNLVQGRSDISGRNVFVRDTCIGAPVGCVPKTYLASVSNDGRPSGDGSYLAQDNSYASPHTISADGSKVAFIAYASDLMPSVVNGNYQQIFVRNTCLGVTGTCTPSTNPVSVNGTGTPADQDVYQYGFGAISGDGSVVAFPTSADNLVFAPADADTNGNPDVFLAATGSAAVTNSADVAVAISGPTASVLQGANITYNITVTNNGPSSASSVTISDPLPAGLSFVSASPSLGSCSGTTTVTCTLAALSSGGSASISLIVTGTSAGVLGNTVTVSANEFDPTQSNNVAHADVQVLPVADVSVTMLASPNAPSIGDTVTYTLTTSNIGPSAATGVVVSQTLPAGATFVSATPSQGSCTGGTTVVCNVGTLNGAGNATITVTATVGSGGTITSTASVIANETDTVSANNTSSATVTSAAEVSVGMVASPLSPSIGGTVTYTITASNAGPSDATAVAVSQTLPAGLTFVSATPAQGTCSGTTTVTCNLGRVAANGSAQVTVNGSVVTGGTLASTVSVTANEPDSVSANNTASANVTSAVDLSVVANAPPTTAAFGSSVTLSYTINNAGPSAATGVVFTGNLAAGITLTSATASQGTCSGSTTIVCNVGTVSAGGAVQVSLTGTVTATGSFNNTASLSGNEPDSNTLNNNVTISFATQAADLAVTATGATMVNGNPAYTATVTNNGPSSAANVVFSDTLDDFGFISATTSVGTCAFTAPAVSCQIGTLANGASATITVVVSAPNGGWASHSFHAASDVSDPNPVNNAVQVTPNIFNTGTGLNVGVQAADVSSGANVQVVFSSVQQPGSTTISGTLAPVSAPAGFRAGTPSVVYDVASTATHSGLIGLAFHFQPSVFHHPAKVRLFHMENGAWVDRTTSVNVSTGTIAGQTTSLSPFVVLEPIDTPPTATAAAASVTGTTSSGAQVQLDGRASSDADGDALTYRWSGPFPEGGGVVTGALPTVTLPLGVSKVTLVVNDGEADSPANDVNVTVADFQLAAGSGSSTVQGGTSATYAISVAPKFGAFSAPVTLGCANLPVGMSCTFSPAVVTPGANGASATLTVSTSPVAGIRPLPIHRNLGWSLLALTLAPFGFVTVGLTSSRRKRYLVLALLVAALITLASCGGGTTMTTSTPAPTHQATTSTVTVTATSAGLTHSTTLSITVQ